MTDTWLNVRMDGEQRRVDGGRDGEEVPVGRIVKSVIEEDSLHFGERNRRLMEI